MDNIIKSIFVLSEGYPAPRRPFFPFVEELCRAFSRKGIKVTVISPQSILHLWYNRIKPNPVERYDSVLGGEPIHVLQPLCFLIPFRFLKLWNICSIMAYNRVLSQQAEKPDIVYGHFWNNAIGAYRFCKNNQIPLFVATGEGNFDVLKPLLTGNKYKKLRNLVRGVIAVSSYTRYISIEYGLTTEDKCIVAPNSIDDSLFKVMDKRQLREKYGYPQDAFIIAFVGGLINRKGSNRVSEAIKLLAEEHIDVNSIFIGKGQGPENLVPDCDGVLHCGPVEHSRIPEYLNMADVFVLPTLNEGCCNAIIEAMACGLPIISSDRPFNYDVLNNTNSILVDPTNVHQIASAIKKVYLDEELRSRMSNSAMETAKGLTIDKRAEKIIGYIRAKMCP